MGSRHFLDLSALTPGALRHILDDAKTRKAATKDGTAGKPRLLLLDGHSLAYRAFFALPVENFSTTTGQPTNAVYGFTAMLINVLRDEAPTHVAVAFDVGRKTFRTETYPDYKGTRKETPADFKGQVELIREVLDALNIRSLQAEGFEADDVIATLAVQGEADGCLRPDPEPQRVLRGGGLDAEHVVRRRLEGDVDLGGGDRHGLARPDEDRDSRPAPGIRWRQSRPR